MRDMEESNTTIDYYNYNAERYFADTVDVDMSECCDRFLEYINPGGLIIDIGAGSGRDMKYFLDRGYEVEGIDASKKMCELASNYTGIEVEWQSIETWVPEKKYNGIWANASLLHLKENIIEKFIISIADYLLDNGVIFMSFKSGIKTGTSNDGRYFTDFSGEKVRKMIEKNSLYSVREIWESSDMMQRYDFSWINIIVQKNIV